MVNVDVNGIVAVERESALLDGSAIDVPVQPGEELGHGRGAVEADDLVGLVEEVDGEGVREGVLVWVLQED